jgi:hypothetical protein
MFFLNIYGGLGNQLFQVAAATLLHEAHGDNVFYSYTGLNYRVCRELEFLNLLMPPPSWLISANSSIPDYFFPKRLSRLLSFLRIGKILPSICYSDEQIVRTYLSGERAFPFILDGYYQTLWTTLNPYDVLDCWSLRTSPPGLEAQGVVYVHIRGSDFLADTRLNLLGLGFYAECFSSAIDQGFTEYRILTDDRSYANCLLKSIILLYPNLRISFVPESSPVEHFNLLRSASYAIIGNSTFAWWASCMSGYAGIKKLFWVPEMFSKHALRPKLSREVIVRKELILTCN